MSVRRNRKGNAAFTALSCITLLGFATLAVDVGHARKAKAELANACDAAALAGVNELNGSPEGITAAENMAVAFGNANEVNGSLMDFTTSDVETGIWDFDASTFTASTDHVQVNALRVIREGHAVDTIFGLAAFGIGQMGAGAQSVAIRPPPTPATGVSCFMPLAVPSCRILQSVDTNGDGTWDPDTESPIAAIDFVTSSNGDDNAAWAALGSSANASYFRDQLLGGSGCLGATLTDNPTVELNNGEVQTVYSLVDDLLTVGTTTVGGTSVTSEHLGTWDNTYWNGYNAPPTWEERMLAEDCDGDGREGENQSVTDAADCDGDGSTTDEVDEASSTSEFGDSDETTAHTRWGETLQGPIMLVAAGDADGNGVDDFCDPNPPNFTGSVPLEGFVWGAIYDVDAQGSDTTLKIRVNVDFDFSEYATSGGGDVDYGLVFNDPGLFGQ